MGLIAVPLESSEKALGGGRKKVSEPGLHIARQVGGTLGVGQSAKVEL
jgi:hypothetical protein